MRVCVRERETDRNGQRQRRIYRQRQTCRRTVQIDKQTYGQTDTHAQEHTYTRSQPDRQRQRASLLVVAAGRDGRGRHQHQHQERETEMETEADRDRHQTRTHSPAVRWAPAGPCRAYREPGPTVEQLREEQNSSERQGKGRRVQR